MKLDAKYKEDKISPALAAIRDPATQTYEDCLYAVKLYSGSIKLVKPKFRTPELCLAAVRAYPLALAYIENPTPELCLEAVKGNSHSLKLVQEQTPEMCIAALDQVHPGWHVTIVGYVHDPALREALILHYQLQGKPLKGVT